MKMMKSVLTLTFAMLVLAAAVPAIAQSSVAECRDRIDLIQDDLNALCEAQRIGGNNPQQTCSSLASKLRSADTKLGQNKFTDAGQKLQDFKTAVEMLRDAAKPKIDPADAALLLDGDDTFPIDEGVNGAIICVSLLP